MNNETSKPIKLLCILSFVIVAITSVPLFVTYLKGISLKNSFVVDLHVSAGVVFIILALMRMTLNIQSRFKNKI